MIFETDVVVSVDALGTEDDRCFEDQRLHEAFVGICALIRVMPIEVIQKELRRQTRMLARRTHMERAKTGSFAEFDVLNTLSGLHNAIEALDTSKGRDAKRFTLK